MFTILKEAEIRLMEMLFGLRYGGGYYALHFHCSQLLSHYRSPYQMKIAVNIIHDLFKSHEGGIFLLHDSDLVVLYKGKDKEKLEKVVFQLRYLFMDDPLAYLPDRTENNRFCSIFDLDFQLPEFIKIAKQKQENMSVATALSAQKDPQEKPTPTLSFRSSHLAHMEEELIHLDIRPAIRRQPICAYGKTQSFTPLFNEIYIHIGHLKQWLNSPIDVHSNPSLFSYLTRLLDFKLLECMTENPLFYLNEPCSINLHVETLLSPAFQALHSVINPKLRSSIIIEIPVIDLFSHSEDFMRARALVSQWGYKLSVDGIELSVLPHINRKKLRLDLLKVRWDAQKIHSLQKDEFEEIKDSIHQSGSHRVILCRCDSASSIQYGNMLDISLYQGRYIDKILFPTKEIVN